MIGRCARKVFFINLCAILVIVANYTHFIFQTTYTTKRSKYNDTRIVIIGAQESKKPFAKI